ncbi:MAG: hypothetical protein V4454_17325 [Pseudomonadota bacterium]
MNCTTEIHATPFDTFFRKVSRQLAVALLVVLAALTGLEANAQTVYGVGSSTTAPTGNRLFSVNPATGAATNLCALGIASAANGVSPVNGLVYYIESGSANPDLRIINPLTCADSLVAASNLVTNIIRMTFCPDGRLYAASNTGSGTNNTASVYIWEVNPATAQTTRRITLTNVRVEGSGDMTCVNNGDLYILANSTRGSTGYSLYRVAGATLQAAANNTAVATTNLGAVGLTGTPNGLSEVSTVVTGCNATITTFPCLIASTGATSQTWGINTQNGAATNIGTTGAGISVTDLSRSFPVDAVVTKSRTSAATIQQASNLTITYVLTVTNSGPGLVGGGATVTDVLDPAIFNAAAATWACSVTTAGSATTITTACGAASGTGNINQVVTLSKGGVLTYNVSAPLWATFNGVAINSASLSLPANVTDTTPANLTGTAPGTTVTAATSLTVSKTNNTNIVLAGSTTTYTITVANTGLADADDSALRDPDVNGLNCTQVACTSAVGNGAVCPAPAGVTVARLQDMSPTGGIRIPDFPYGSTFTFTLTCGVEADGLP